MCFIFGDVIQIGPSVGVSKDRADVYDVKILPNDISDSALNLLDASRFSYLAIVDAGSSGCRAHVYRYGKLGSLTGPLYVLPQHTSKKVKPGLSSFASNPNDAGESLEGLVEFLKTQVPESYWSKTPIWLKATAGLRMLALDKKDKSDAILKSVAKFLSDKSKCPFFFRYSWAKIISGNEEAGFGWIAYNYLKKIIGPKKSMSQKPYVVVEMGGASSQVSQLAPPSYASLIPKDYKFSFDIEGEEYTLYTYSYLGYGADAARETVNKMLTNGGKESGSITDPCLFDGYKRDSKTERKDPYEGPLGSTVIGTAKKDVKQCFKNVAQLFNSNKGSCPSSGPHSFDCIYQPDFITASENILVFENFYYVTSALGFKSKTSTDTPFPLLTTPSEITQGANEICQMELDKVNDIYPKDSQPKDVNLKLCFASTYASSFLTKGIGFKDNKLVTIQKEVDGNEIEWALGAAYREASAFLKRTNLRGD